MQFKKLIVTDILEESSFIFDFESKKKAHRKKDIDQLKSVLFYVFFGNPTLSKGKVEFTFEHDGDCLLLRDFGENIALLQTKDGKIEGEDAVNEYFHNILGMDKNDWAEFFFVDDESMYEGSFERTSEYFLSFLSKLSIDKNDIDDAIVRYKDHIAGLTNRNQVLADIAAEYNEREISEVAEKLHAEAVQLQQQLNEERSFLLLEGKAQEADVELRKTQKEYADLVSKEKDIGLLRKRLKKSEEIKSMLVALRKSAAAIQENDELKSCIETKKEELKTKIKESNTGERVLAEKQANFSKLSATIQGQYTALSELICANAASAKSEELILSNVEKHFEGMQKVISTLRKEEEDLKAQLAQTEKEITVYTKKYTEMQTAQTFDKLFLFNQEQIDEAAEKLSTVLTEEINTPQAASAYYFALEKKKEELSRTYILVDSILKETDSIDAKINENNAAVNNQQENLDALENAKETLTRYMEKCRKKVDTADEEIFALSTRKQYYSEIEKLEYGQHCPICNMPVVDKQDISEAVALTDMKLKKQCDEVASFREVMTEYSSKLDEINLRIGALRAKINTGRGYIESLEQSKLTKTAYLKKLLTEANVRDRDELIALLEKTVNEIARISDTINNLNAIKASAYVSGENAKRISVYVKELAGEDNGEAIALARNNLLALEKEEELPIGTISGEGEIEGDVYQKIKELLEKKKQLLFSLADIRATIENSLSREATVIEEGKPYTYGQMCILYSGKQYTSIIDEIRVKEEEKQALINEIAALTGVLKSKKAIIEESAEEIRELENRFKSNLEYLETIQADERYDTEVLKTKPLAQLEEEVLSDGDVAELTRQIAEYDEKAADLNMRCHTLQSMAKVTMNSIEWETRKVDLKDLENALTQKTNLLDEAHGLLSISRTITTKRNLLMKEVDLYRENYAFVNHIYEDNAWIIKDTVNYALRELFPSYHVDNESGGLVLKRGEKKVNSVSDDVYYVLVVALADAFRYIVTGILDRPNALRMVVLKSAALGEGLRGVIDGYAKAHNLVVLYR